MIIEILDHTTGLTTRCHEGEFLTALSDMWPDATVEVVEAIARVAAAGPVEAEEDDLVLLGIDLAVDRSEAVAKASLVLRLIENSADGISSDDQIEMLLEVVRGLLAVASKEPK